MYAISDRYPLGSWDIFIQLVFSKHLPNSGEPLNLYNQEAVLPFR